MPGTLTGRPVRPIANATWVNSRRLRTFTGCRPRSGPGKVVNSGGEPWTEVAGHEQVLSDVVIRSHAEDSARRRRIDAAGNYGISLGAVGLRSTACESAEQAMEWLRQQLPSLVIVDQDLPGIDGIEFSTGSATTCARAKYL